jgi:hypothetical protein
MGDMGDVVMEKEVEGIKAENAKLDERPSLFGSFLDLGNDKYFTNLFLDGQNPLQAPVDTISYNSFHCSG